MTVNEKAGVDAKRDWTQDDIYKETCKRHSGPGFFRVLDEVCDEAFAGVRDYGCAAWEFPMGSLTVGQLIDFFAEHKAGLLITWRNEGGAPFAYVEIADYDLAESFRNRFKVKWLSVEEVKQRDWQAVANFR